MDAGDDLITVAAYRREHRGDTGRRVSRIVDLCKRMAIPVTKHAPNGVYAIPRRYIPVLDAELDRSVLVLGDSLEEMGTPIGSLVYVVVLDPEARPGRIKVGCTNNMAQRLSTFKAICPDAEVLDTYRVGKECEGYALALASSIGTRFGMTEVFDFDLDQLDKFTSLLAQAFAPLRLVEDEEEEEEDDELS